MTALEVELEGVDAPLLRDLIARAPCWPAVLTGREMSLRVAHPDLRAGLGPGARLGEPCREALGESLGRGWVERIDRCRDAGTARRGLASVGDRGAWEIAIEPLSPDAVALYVRPVPEGQPMPAELSEALHPLRNAVYGIRVATKVLLAREPEGDLREILEEMTASAERAERCVKLLDRW